MPGATLSDIGAANGVSKQAAQQALSRVDVASALQRKRAAMTDKATGMAAAARKIVRAGLNDSNDWTSQEQTVIGLQVLKVAIDNGDTGDATVDVAATHDMRQRKLRLHLRYALRSPAAAAALLERLELRLR